MCVIIIIEVYFHYLKHILRFNNSIYFFNNIFKRKIDFFIQNSTHYSLSLIMVVLLYNKNMSTYTNLF